MDIYKITHPDGSTIERSGNVENGIFGRIGFYQDGWKYKKVRTNPDPYDDDEPEYKTKRTQNIVPFFIPCLNRELLIVDGLIDKAQSIKPNKPNCYKGYEKYFLKLGQNELGPKIEKIS